MSAPFDRSPEQRLQALRESLQLAYELADALTLQARRVQRHCEILQAALADEDAAVVRGPVEEARAHLVALDMALEGRSADEVRAFLADEGIEADVDVDTVVQSVFGDAER